MVALHGGGVDARLYELLAPRLQGLELLAPELAPLATQCEGRLDRMLSLLAAAVPAEREVILVGNSIGAMLASGLAVRLKPRLRGLLLLSPGPLVTDDAFHERMRGLRDLLGIEQTPERLQSAVRMMVFAYGPFCHEALPRVLRMAEKRMGPSSRPLMDLVQQLRGPGPDLEQLTCPVRVMFGAFDSFQASPWLDGWRARLGRERVTLVPDCCHQLPIERPDVVAETLLQLAAGN